MDGLTEVRDDSSCPYTADATGGIPPYNYRWFIDDDSILVAGDQEDLEIDDVGDESFVVEVRFMDDVNQTSWDGLEVDVSWNDPSSPPIL